MSIQELRDRILHLGRSENGSAMTEFVFFLPVWVTVFVGIVQLGKLGVETNMVKIQAQRQMWVDVMAATGGLHLTSTGGGGEAAANMISLATQSDTPIRDGVDAVVMGELALDGHWGESYVRTLPIKTIAQNPSQLDDLTRDPEDILGKASDNPYPHYILDDGVVKSYSNGGIAGAIASLLSGSGAGAALGAGIRYGEVFVAKSHGIQLSGFGTVTAHAHHDLLVAPVGYTGLQSDKVPWVLARLFAEVEDPYSVMMNFGEKEWEGDEGAGKHSNADDVGDPENDDKVKDEKDRLDDAQEGYDDCVSGWDTENDGPVNCGCNPASGNC